MATDMDFILPGQGSELCRVRRWSGTAGDIGRQMAAGFPGRPAGPETHYLLRWRGWRSDPSAVSRARAIAMTLDHAWPPLLAEVESFAAALAVDPRAVLADWAAPPVRPRQGGRSCTVFWLPPELTRRGRPLVGRNYDLRVRRPDRQFIYTEPRHGLAHAGMGGRSGRAEGINAAGLVVGTTEAQVREELLAAADGPAAHGERIGGRGAAAGAVPARLATRIVLETCRTVDEALACLDRLAHWTHFNFLLADVAGDAAVFEVGFTRTAVRRPPGRSAGEPWLITTNHYLSPELAAEADYRWLTVQKYRAAEACLEEVVSLGRAGEDDCQAVLRAPGVAQRHITLWSEVFEPGGDLLWLAPGRPDRNRFLALPAPQAGCTMHRPSAGAAVQPPADLPVNA